jgi:hypothetical protein
VPQTSVFGDFDLVQTTSLTIVNIITTMAEAAINVASGVDSVITSNLLWVNST